MNLHMTMMTLWGMTMNFAGDGHDFALDFHVLDVDRDLDGDQDIIKELSINAMIYLIPIRNNVGSIGNE